MSLLFLESPDIDRILPGSSENSRINICNEQGISHFRIPILLPTRQLINSDQFTDVTDEKLRRRREDSGPLSIKRTQANRY